MSHLKKYRSPGYKYTKRWNNLEIPLHTYPAKQLFFICLFMAGTLQPALSQPYFQQEVNYNINVTLNDRIHELNAFETIEYINHSPDTLRYLYFHLWPNGYSRNNTELAKQLFTLRGKDRLFNDPALKGYIDALDFKTGNQQLIWELLAGQPDICKITLHQNLEPGNTVQITTPFHIKIPEGVTSRLGHIGESYQISQWYPKPAVYDKSGWHQMPYLDQGEFYSEFGSFDVSITLPANYVVGATGELQNKQEMQMLDNLATDTTWKSSPDTGNNNFPPSSEQMKTLRYTGSQIHDFAWFADKRFHVLKGKVKLPESSREVITWAMFTSQQTGIWKDAVTYINNAIVCFSKWNGDYPYQSYTAVQSALSAGEGMEYPGIAVIGLTESGYALDQVIAHEVAHNWFYSALGSDERQYPFMDEGITSAYETRYLKEKYPERKLWETYFKNRKLSTFFHLNNVPVERMEEMEWLMQARTNLEQPIDLPAPDYDVLNYSIIIYYKAAMAFNYLRAYLGDSIFDATVHDYYRVWKFKHPQPDDLRLIFESKTGKDLSWFFKDMLTTTKRIDYALVRISNQQVLVKNNGEMASPVVICGMDGDSVCFQKWVEGFQGQQWIDIPHVKYSEIRIDPTHIIPDVFRHNNNIRSSGIFRKADPMRLQYLFTIEDPDNRYIMYIPSVNWTKEDGFMVGLTLHNGFLVTKPVEYFVMPFYSWKNPGPIGFGRVSFNITPYNNWVRMTTITLEGTKFGAPGNQNYYKAKTGLDVYFRTVRMNNPLRQKIFGYYISASNLSQIEHMEKASMNSFLQFGYQLENPGLVNPFKLITQMECNTLFQKTSVDFNYKFSYNGKNRGLYMRFFAGTMLSNTSHVPFYGLAPGGRSGPEQYLYEGLFPERFTAFPRTFFSRQMTLSEGGLASPVNDSLGYSHRLFSLSFTSSLPGRAIRIPVKPFVTFLWNDHGSGMDHSSPFFLEAGLKAGLWNVFEVYVPLLVSGNIKSMTGTVKDRIRIILSLESFNQLKLKAKGL